MNLASGLEQNPVRADLSMWLKKVMKICRKNCVAASKKPKAFGENEHLEAFPYHSWSFAWGILSRKANERIADIEFDDKYLHARLRDGRTINVSGILEGGILCVCGHHFKSNQDS